MTHADAVVEQAGAIAAAWSPANAPPSWRLTAAQFEALRDDPELAAIAATIPPEKLPPLLFQAAAAFVVLELRSAPLRAWFPTVGEPQPPLDPAFRGEYRQFCLDHRDRILELCAEHRYQMNEVGRCADVVPALAPLAAEGREIVLIDIGTGAGLGLHLDRYRYVYRAPDGHTRTTGPPDSPLTLEVDVRGGVPPPLPPKLPSVSERIGVDTEPLDLADDAVRAWLAACVPQEIGAVNRFHHATEIALRHGAPTIRGDACEVLPALLDELPTDRLVCVVDTYVHVFFPPDRLERFRNLVDAAGARRDIDWISVDPLVPMGPEATGSVLGVPVPGQLLDRNRAEGVFGVVGRVSYRGGRRQAALMALAHPSAAWLEWLAPGQRDVRLPSAHAGVLAP